MSRPRPDLFAAGNAEIAIALATYLPPIAALMLLAAVLHVIASFGRSLLLRLRIAFQASNRPAE